MKYVLHTRNFISRIGRNFARTIPYVLRFKKDDLRLQVEKFQKLFSLKLKLMEFWKLFIKILNGELISDMFESIIDKETSITNINQNNIDC